MKNLKNNKEVIKFMKENRKKAFIFDAATQGIEKFNIPVETMLYHVILYQFNLIATQNQVLENLKNGKN